MWYGVSGANNTDTIQGVSCLARPLMLCIWHLLLGFSFLQALPFMGVRVQERWGRRAAASAGPVSPFNPQHITPWARSAHWKPGIFQPVYLKLYFSICGLLMRLKNSVTGNDNCSLSNIKQILASLGATQESAISAIEQAKAMSNMILIRQWVLYLPT